MHANLAKIDPLFKRLIKEHGKIDIPAVKRGAGKREPWQALVRSIAYQQLHGKAAETIFNRFLDHFGGNWPTPAQILKTRDASMRKFGFSASKTAAIKDIAKHTQLGTIPDFKTALKMGEDELIARLTQIRGVGKWTVEMLMIFTLGKPDVLSVGDFGIRNGYSIATGRSSMITEKELAALGPKWAPYRTLVSLYCWRAADKSKEKKVTPIKKTAAKKPAAKKAAKKKVK